jgi:xanthine dehydrogenase accessory factor
VNFQQQAMATLQRERRCALVTLSSVQGSSPREEGAQMLVTASGILGTIGGGALEWQALAAAQKLLAGEPTTAMKTFLLGPDLGQCCGGRVTVVTEVISSEARLASALTPQTPMRQVFLYGAGHVGKSLILLLAQAPYRITWVDPRSQVFPEMLPSNTSIHNQNDILQPLSIATPGSLLVVMSHSHELDFAVTDAGLRKSEFDHVLLIGSDTKRARFHSRLKNLGHTSENLSRLICPIGDGNLQGKTPYAVALSTAHQLLTLDEALALGQRTEANKKERRVS